MADFTESTYLVKIQNAVEIVDPIDVNDINIKTDSINALSEAIGSKVGSSVGGSIDMTEISNAINNLSRQQDDSLESLDSSLGNINGSLGGLNGSLGNIDESIKQVTTSINNYGNRYGGNRYANEDCAIFDIALNLFANNLPLTVGQVSPQEIAKNSIKSAEIFWRYFKSAHPNILTNH